MEFASCLLGEIVKPFTQLCGQADLLRPFA
jgi:hypothetical protein